MATGRDGLRADDVSADAVDLVAFADGLYNDALWYERMGDQGMCTACLEIVMSIQRRIAGETEEWRAMTRREG